MAASLDVREPGDFTVIIPTHTSQLGDRFTIAHELGHYFLHYGAPESHRTGERTSTFTRLGRNVAETQANVFVRLMSLKSRRRQLDADMRGRLPGQCGNFPESRLHYRSRKPPLTAVAEGFEPPVGVSRLSLSRRVH